MRWVSGDVDLKEKAQRSKRHANKGAGWERDHAKSGGTSRIDLVTLNDINVTCKTAELHVPGVGQDPEGESSINPASPQQIYIAMGASQSKGESEPMVFVNEENPVPVRVMHRHHLDVSGMNHKKTDPNRYPGVSRINFPP